MASCKDCFYSRSIGNDEAVACHRYPPAITSVEGLRVTSHFPLLTNTEWCGEWKLNTVRSKIEPTIKRTAQ